MSKTTNNQTRLMKEIIMYLEHHEFIKVMYSDGFVKEAIEKAIEHIETLLGSQLNEEDKTVVINILLEEKGEQ